MFHPIVGFVKGVVWLGRRRWGFLLESSWRIHTRIYSMQVPILLQIKRLWGAMQAGTNVYRPDELFVRQLAFHESIAMPFRRNCTMKLADPTQFMQLMGTEMIAFNAKDNTSVRLQIVRSVNQIRTHLNAEPRRDGHRLQGVIIRCGHARALQKISRRSATLRNACVTV